MKKHKLEVRRIRVTIYDLVCLFIGRVVVVSAVTVGILFLLAKMYMLGFTVFSLIWGSIVGKVICVLLFIGCLVFMGYSVYKSFSKQSNKED